MGRLFWKFFFVIWLALVAAGLGAGTVAWLRWHSAADPGRPASGFGPRRPEPPPEWVLRHPSHLARHYPLVPLGMALAASLVSSALLAGYVARPIRSLRWAFEAVGQGCLDTRVQPRMGRRRDEIADLGRGFDRMTGQLERLIDAQRRLLHDVSHELRSPLARLQAAVGLARQSPQNPQKVEASLDRIEREAARLDALVGELLTLSHLEAGTAGEPRERVDLVELVAAIADDARFEAQAAGREVRFVGRGEAMSEVHAEPLHRAFENVIRNAVKFTAEGSLVEVEAGLNEAGDRFRVTVADRGPGVAERDLERIFEPFHRGESGPIGTGLGLAIARRAVEVHGGTIRARHREGGGLLVEVELPVSRPS